MVGHRGIGTLAFVYYSSLYFSKKIFNKHPPRWCCGCDATLCEGSGKAQTVPAVTSVYLWRFMGSGRDDSYCLILPGPDWRYLNATYHYRSAALDVLSLRESLQVTVALFQMIPNDITYTAIQSCIYMAKYYYTTDTILLNIYINIYIYIYYWSFMTIYK